MHLSMLLHCLIDNEQHDQQRLETNYWQNNLLKDMILQYKNKHNYRVISINTPWNNFTTMSAIRYFMRLSMLLHCLIDNEEHDQ